MRHLLTILVFVVALVAPATVSSASQAVDARSCVQSSASFNVELLGDKSASSRVSFNGRTLAGVPDGKAVAVVWSLGGPVSTSGIAVYGWATAAQFRFGMQCSGTRPPKVKAPRGLRAPVRMKNGWHDSARYLCLQPGRFLLDVREVKGGQRLTIRMARSGALIAVAELGPGGGWVRGSRRCDAR